METSMTYIAKFSKSLTRHLLTADSDPMQLLSSHFLLCRLCSINIALTTIGWSRVCCKRYQLLKSLKICTNVLPTCSPTPTWP